MGCSVRIGMALGVVETFAADITSYPPARSLPPDIASTPFWSCRALLEKGTWCGSQKALKETACSADTSLMDIEEITRKQM